MKIDKQKLKTLFFRFDEYIEWDYGFSLIKSYQKFKNSKNVDITNKVGCFFLGLFTIVAGFGVGGILSLFFFAYPAFTAILLTIDLMLVVVVYYEYNGYMEDVKQCITGIIKNVHQKKTKN